MLIRLAHLQLVFTYRITEKLKLLKAIVFYRSFHVVLLSDCDRQNRRQLFIAFFSGPNGVQLPCRPLL